MTASAAGPPPADPPGVTATTTAASAARGRGRVPGWTWHETQVWRLTNAERAKAGLAALKPDACLRDVATDWATGLVARGELDHGDVPARLRPCTGSRGYSGENLAYGYETPAELVAAWMNSPHHRENILDPSFRYLGVGIAGAQTAYASQVFTAELNR